MAAAAIVALAGTPASAQQPGNLGQQYTITDLGVPFTLNDTDSHATAINSSGTVVGYSGVYSNDLQFLGFLNQDAFIWVPDSKNGTTGTMTYLGGLSGDYCFSPEHTVGGLTTPAGFGLLPTVAQDINSAGQVVGWSYTSTDGLCTDAFIHAALWQNGSAADLGAPPGYKWSYAGSVNDKGQIVGWAQATNQSTTADAFFINNGGFNLLGSLYGVGNGFAIPKKINSNGTLVGADIAFGFVHTGVGPILPSDTIGTLGGAYSGANAINNAGRIVGSSSIGGDYVASHAYYIDPSGMHDLGTESLNPLANSQANAINNNANDVVGWSNVDPVHMWLSDQHAVIWRGGGELVDLNALLDPTVVPPYGTANACPHIQCWELVAATGVNDLGQIVGEGILVPQGQTTGNRHAFLLTPICATQGGDSDGDGLCDNWEKYGFTAPDGTFVDLPAMGADPNHKDIFIQADYMENGGSCDGLVCNLGHTHKPNPDAIAAVTAAFANAPVDNPDGKTGITLHIDSGADSIMNPLTGATWDGLSQAHDMPETPILGQIDVCPPEEQKPVPCSYDFTDFNAIGTANMAPSRLHIFHYILFAHEIGDYDNFGNFLNTSGITPFLPGNASIVSLGGYYQQLGTSQNQAGTLMHELGHQLGLLHGGQDDINFKPNYLSVMNYSFQMDGLLVGGANSLLDYSEFSSIPPLNEDSLNDTVGLNGGPAIANYGTVYYCPSGMTALELSANGPIDWACDGSASQTNVGADIAKTGNLFTILNDYEDWHHLIYNGGTIGGLGIGSPFVQPSVVAEPETFVPPSPVAPYRVQIASPGYGNIPLGANVTLNFTISNTGTQADTYSLTATTADSLWNTSGIPNTITLAAGASRQITVPLAISGCTTSGFKTQLTLRAVSQAHPAIYDSAFASLNVQGSVGGIGVPSLAGLPQSEATSVIIAAGFTLGTVTMQSSSTVPAGSVISQAPTSCGLAAAGTAISIVVSSGPAATIVPNVVGLTQAAAVAAMNAAGLTIGSAPITVFSSTVPAGDVVSQNPPAGTEVTPGTFFSLTIASATPAYDLTPNVVGDPISTAMSAISAAGLNLGLITQSFSLTLPDGTVVSQVPAAGSPTSPSSYVNVTVSYRYDVLNNTPNLVGDTQAAAISAILTAGYSIGSIGEAASNTEPAGIVFLQSPLAGFLLSPTTPVSFSISTGPVGPQSFVVPNVYGLTQSAASSAITAAGLTVGTITPSQELSVPVGDVFSQTPQPGAYAAGGSAVNLQVSAAAAQYTVPDLVTKPTYYLTAYADIIAAGLTPGTFTAQISSTVGSDFVISESPAAATVVAGGSVVNVTYFVGIANNTVPNLVGKNQVFATNSIDPGGLIFFLSSVTREPSTTVPDSFVISQNPPANAQAPFSAPISLVVSSGGPVAAAVPNVVGTNISGISQTGAFPIGATEPTLNAAGFAVGSVTYQPSNSVPFGEVISQTPPAGTIAEWDTSVSFVYSSGPPTSVTVPNIVGKTQASAISYLNAFSLQWTLTTQSSQSVPAGVVISQNPSAGTVLQGAIPATSGRQVGTVPVTFVVSAGPNTVPTYSLLTQFGDYGGPYSGDGQFYTPVSLAIDPNTGNILAGDETGRIQIFDRNGNFKGYFGGTGVEAITATVPGTNQLATFYPTGTGGGLFAQEYLASVATNIVGFPTALAVDPINGNVVALDAAERVLIFNSAGVLQSTFGSPGQGPGQFAFILGDLSLAGGVAIDPDTENILVTDLGNNRVQIFSSTGVYLGQFGTQGAGNGQFGYGPFGIAIDPETRNIVVMDNSVLGNARVEIFNSSGAYLSQFGAPAAANASWSFCGCEALAIDPISHNIIVQGSISGVPAEPAVQIFDSKGNYLSQFGGFGTTQPGGLAVDPVSHHIVTFGLAGDIGGMVQIFGAPGALTPTSTALTSSLNPAASGQSVTFTATVTGASPTGTVQFYYGDTPLGSPVALAAGMASFTTSSLPIGTDSITAAYSGDANNLTSESPLNETVTGTGSTTVLATSVNPVIAGHAVTLTATVTGSTPTGTVEFFDGETSLGLPLPLSAGVAGLTTSDLPVGSDSITAVYSGDGLNAPSTSAVLIENVLPAGTVTSMLTSNEQAIAGQPVAFTAIVSGDGPTGTIQFMNGAASLGGSVTLSGGVATMTTSSLSAGTHAITAVYGGDPLNIASTSAPLNEVILAAGTTVTSVSSSMNPASVEQAVTFTANVTGSSPTGSVQFMDGGTALGGPAPVNSGAASLSTSSLAGGVHSIVAVYSGDVSNTTSTSSALSEVISRVATSTVLTSSLNPATVGQTVTLTAKVTGSSPTGTIQFADGTTPVGSPVTVTMGAATSSTSALTVGTHSIIAVYSGDASNVTSTSPAVSEVITNKVTTTTTVSSSLDPAMAGLSVTFTANVVGSAPSGTVQFMDGPAALGGPVALAAGSASLTTSSLSVGTHSITAVYSGDGSNAGGTSSALSEVVSPVASTPVVTPPASIAIPATQPGGATSAASPALAAFLAGGSAVDSSDPSPMRLTPQVGGVPVSSSTVFPIGTTTVTFLFENAGGNIGSATARVTVSVGVPRITGSSVGVGIDPSGAIYVDVRLTNTGTGNAQNVTITTIPLRVLSGSGTVAYNSAHSPSLPIAMGNIAVGAYATKRIYLNVPAAVTRLSITENGSAQDINGTNYNYSTLETVVP